MSSTERQYEPYPLVAAIVDRTTVPTGDLSVPIGDWRVWFKEQMCAHVDGLRFEDDESLYVNDVDIAFYRFIPVEDAVEQLGQEPWFSRRYRCPWLTDTLGFFTWTQYNGFPDEGWFHESIQRVSWGWITNLKRGEIRHSVTDVSYPLCDALTNTGGFCQGEYFLSLEGPYMEYAAEQVRAALHDAGLAAPIYIMGLEGVLELGLTPIFIEAEELRTLDGRKVRRPYRELRDRKVKLWSFDCTILDDRFFWRS